MKYNGEWWLFLLLIPLFVYAYFRDKQTRRCETQLFSRHNVDTPDLYALNEALNRLNKECPAFSFYATQCLNMAFRGQNITLARGPVVFFTQKRIGADWTTSELLFVVCPTTAEVWGRKQNDVLKKATRGSELIVYWLKDIYKIAGEMEKIPTTA